MCGSLLMFLPNRNLVRDFALLINEIPLFSERVCILAGLTRVRVEFMKKQLNTIN